MDQGRSVGAGPGRSRPGGRRWWVIAAPVAIGALALALYTWALSRNGMGNSYYAAAVKSGTLSWEAFFFGSLDPGSFITVDKLPAGMWIPALFARLFGFSSWSILLPQALAGAASVLILHRLVRRWAGEVAAVLSALAFAFTPVAVMIFRLNNPDAFLTLLLLLAAWAVWSAFESGSTWRLVVAGALVGLAFLTKMLEAFVVLPALILLYLLCGPRGFGRRVLQLLASALALVAAGGWWVAIVERWPVDTRPYIGGSTDNSVVGLVFSRSAGYFGGAVSNPNFGGNPGWLRMFNTELGGQISWLIPLALLGLAAGLFTCLRVARTDKSRAGYLLWGLWSLILIAVFSGARGVLHPYYAVLLAPGLAALAGAGSVQLWRLGRSRRWLAWLLPAGVLGTSLLSAELLERTPGYAPGLALAVTVVGAVAAAAVLVVLARLVRWRVAAWGAAVVATGVVLTGPVAYSVTTVGSSLTGPLAAAGPVSGGARGPSGLPPGPGPRVVPRGGDLTVDQALVAYLQQHRSGAKFLVAVQGSSAAVPLILATGEPVIAMGGFSGNDPAPTVAQLERLISEGKVRYVLIGGAGGFGGGGLPVGGPPVGSAGGAYRSGPPGGAYPSGSSPASPPVGGRAQPQQPPGGPVGPGGTMRAVVQWVAARGTVVPFAEYGGRPTGGTLYYLP